MDKLTSASIFAQNTEMAKEIKAKVANFNGEIYTNEFYRLMYATDASIYREIPLAVAYPKNVDDLKALIDYAKQNQTSLIPRAAGTSLAGQCVGKGIIVDFSKHFTKIKELNAEERWVIVEPGVNLLNLNNFLKKHNLFFGPETSTANRCLMGGMVANNACGLHSLIYGSTRDHTLEIKALLEDKTECLFKKITKEELLVKVRLENAEGTIYREIQNILTDEKLKADIASNYPKATIPRRNTGYALDLLNFENLNVCKILSGSEGTLCFFTEIKLNLVELPPNNAILLCVHLNSINEAIEANLIALKHQPDAIELMDKTILNLTKENIEQRKNRFFIEGEPAAVLFIEFNAKHIEIAKQKAKDLVKELKNKNLGYHFPLLENNEITKAWNLRKAGLGVLSNMPGDPKPIAVIEDTTVDVKDLMEYIAGLNAIFKKMNIECTYHAHIGTGELHLRPVLNLKEKEDRDKFVQIATETAVLIKKFRGSLSGEHGDGRLRSAFVKDYYGDTIYEAFLGLKKAFDPYNIFNKDKIISSIPIDSGFRVMDKTEYKPFKTYFDFSDYGSYEAGIEHCNGSADCRKTAEVGGTMCPSYMATMDEKNTTRARANLLRELIVRSKAKNRFSNRNVYKVLDLCLSCKACKAECPSNVDMARFKAEFLQHYFKFHLASLRTRIFAHINRINQLAQPFYRIYNTLISNKITSFLFKNAMGIALQRSFPKLYSITLKKWALKEVGTHNIEDYTNTVYVFIDEFSNYNDLEVGKSTILLLKKLKYNIKLLPIKESARSFISKGFIRKAKKIINSNLKRLSQIAKDDFPIVGIEPSAILGFKDEFLTLALPENKETAKLLAQKAMLIDCFIANEMRKGNIKKELFTDMNKKILLHGHCHQKALGSVSDSLFMLSFPLNYQVKEIPSGCCGMAGSFGYEKEHYDLSMKIGEMVLFPGIRNRESEDTIIAAPGISCRQQIKEGTAVKAMHPVEIIFQALKV